MVSLTDGQKASLSPQAVDFLTKLRHPPFADTISSFLTMPSRISGLRETFATKLADGEAKLIEAHDLKIRHVKIAGVPVVVIEPPQVQPNKKNKIMLNIFGGGFTLGSPRDRAALTTAAEFGVPVYSPAYTRAPQARYPVARDQCLAVYRALISLGPPDGNGPIDPANIYTQGSSSG